MDQRLSDQLLSDDWDDRERRLEHFEEAWRNGPPPDLDEFLPPRDAQDDRRELLEELIKIDLEYRWRKSASGQAAWLLEDYLEQFPDLGPVAELPSGLIAEEYRARQRWGGQPGLAEYLVRFPGREGDLREILDQIDGELTAESERGTPSPRAEPEPSSSPKAIRCPHCRHAIDVVAELVPRDLACPACGGAFSLETISTTGRQAGQPPVQRVGRYELRSLLGTGAFGSVWRAWDTELAREVAVKLPRSGEFPTRAEEERFLREARSSAQLQHPGIVAIHDVGRYQDKLYIVSDLVRGRSLAQWLRIGRLSFSEAAELTARVADALDYAHRQGVVHRDVKPANILLTGAVGPGPLTIDPKLTDFGLAKRDAGEITMTLDGELLGTPAYMSPEQIRDPHAVDGRSDIYSLGVILYQLLTGELPFRGATRMLLLQVVCDEPRPPRELNDHVPRDLETICLKCLAKEPFRRYRTAGVLAQDLRRWMAGDPIEAQPAGRVERLWRWLKRNPVLALTGTLGTAVFVSVFGAPAALIVVVLAIVAAFYALRQARVASELNLTLHQLSQDQLRTAAALEMSLKQCYVARQERDRAHTASAEAQHRLQPARELVRTILFDLLDRLANVPGSLTTRTLLVQKCQVFLDRLHEGAKEDNQLLRELAAAYLRIGDLLGNPHLANLGDIPGALASYRKSVDLFQGLAQSDSFHGQAQRDLAVALHKLGLSAAELGASEQQSKEKRLKHWKEAQAHQQRSLNLILDLRRRGTLAQSDTTVPEMLSAEIGRCEQVIKQLKNGESA